MTHPIRNRYPERIRNSLMLGCGSTALALALALAPQDARAQAVNATPNVVVGAANIVDPAVGQTTVEVAGPTTVIDWTPTEDGNGDALTFLPAGNTLTFDASVIPDFAVLNRILPSTNGNVAVIDGNVISQLTDLTGISTPGGFVAFYSPTGILIGDNASFDVGRLMLTTLDVSPTDFQNFAEQGGNMTLAAAPGSTARIQINPGAQITATPENSFFAVVAADVQMLGTAQINGSHAYVAGEVVNLSFSNGLFFISVPVGTAATGTVMEVDGTVGGPSSTGLAGDNHMIYGVAAAQADPISMIFRGNLGFDPAQSAGIVNGEIILSANHDVFGRFVDGGSISDGINAVFGANSATGAVRADIFMEDFAASSSVLAIGTHSTQITANTIASSVAGNLLLVGRETASLTALNGQNFTITGDVLVSAQDYGVVSSSLQSLDQINAAGGNAFIDSAGGATMNIGGSALVAADAFAGADDLNLIAGTAQGGQALIGSTGGNLTITGNAIASARGVGAPLNSVQTGATSRGGLASLFVRQGGTVTLNGSLNLDAGATGAQGSLISPSSVSDAFGGNASVNIFDGGGSIAIGGDVFALASAIGGSSNNAGAGSVGDAGQAVAVIDGAGLISITGSLELQATGTGGTNAGGIGGAGLGGRASGTTLSGGTIVIGNGFEGDARGSGGNGQTGGDGLGGIAGANAVIGTITITDVGLAATDGIGGSAIFGFGGNGGLGRGGNSFFQADGTLTQTAELTLGGGATAFSQGFGGTGGQTDGNAIPAGRGGDGYGGQFTVPNQADPAFGSGVYILAGGDNGTLSIGGSTTAFASGFAGSGGGGSSTLPGGRGGDAFGGLAQIGLALLGQDGSLGQGSATFDIVFAEANGFGGSGGFSINDFPTGDGGNAIGGNAFLTVRAGTVTANLIDLNASGFGGQGQQGGNGGGGIAAAFGSLGGVLNLGQFNALANGFGGFSGLALGGIGQGGEAAIELQGIAVTVSGDTLLEASGFGGSSDTANGSDGLGGTAYIAVTNNTLGSGTFSGNTQILANGFGGTPGIDGTGGTGRGGLAYAEAQGGSTVRFGTLQVTASGQGGTREDLMLPFVGGNGFGGAAELRSTGTGSQLIVERNFDFLQFANSLNNGAIVGAMGLGGDTTGGSGIGGTGTGGSVLISAAQGGSLALPADPNNDPGSSGFIRLFARGFGGNTNVTGGTGGSSFGGSVAIDVDGGSLSMGETVLSAFTQAGTAFDGALDVTGGNAFAGSRRVSIRNGGTANLFLVGGGAGAQGGAGTGTGNGGDAYVGTNLFEVDNATVNITGQLDVFDQSTGGVGQQGGSVFRLNPITGVTGSLAIAFNNATVNFTPDAAGLAGIGIVSTSTGGDGVTRGGNVEGGIVDVAISQTSLSGGGLTINPIVAGGNASAIDGVGGDAFGWLATVAITGSQLTLAGETLFAADARGGAGGSNGTGGNAASGTMDVTITGSTIALVADQQGAPGILRVRSQADSGGGAAMGNATSGRAFLSLAGTTLDAVQVSVEARGFANANAAGPTGGVATGGSALIAVSGNSQVTAGLIEIVSNAETSIGGTTQAGSSSLQVASGSTATVNADIINLLADGFGGDFATLANTAGVFSVNIGGGNVNAGSLFASATGDTFNADPAVSELVASGGNLNVRDNLFASSVDDILIRTGGGGIIGGPRAATTATNVSISTPGEIRVEGDGSAAGGLGGAVVGLLVSDIEIANGARIAADAVFINSIDRVNTATLGGSTQGSGFTLTGAEFGRISARELSIFLPNLDATNNPNQPDVVIRDMSVSGSAGNGLAQLNIFAGSDAPDAIVRVEGTLSYVNAAATDVLSINALRLEVVTPGGIRMEGAGNVPSGVLDIFANDIWAADAAVITQLQADRNFAGRDALLATAATGSADPLGYIRAGSVTLSVQDSLLVRNTGVAFEGGGILVGDGGLSIVATGASQSTTAPQLDVFAYGRRRAADGSFIVGEAFFDEVNFNRVAPGTTAYLDAAAFNDCLINTGLCPEPPPPSEPPVEPPLVITNPTIIEGPLETGSGELPMSSEEEEERFGMDFPERPDAPLISEDPLLDDPVSSGGDASLYSGDTNAAPRGGEQ